VSSYCGVTDNRTESRENNESDEDLVNWRSEVPQNLHSVCPELDQTMSKSENGGMIPQMNGIVRPNNGSNPADDIQYNIVGVPSSCMAGTPRIAQRIRSGIDHQPAVYNSSDGLGSPRDLQCRQPSCDDGRESSSTDCCQNSLNGVDYDNAKSSTTPISKSPGVYYQNRDISNADLESLGSASNNCRKSDTTNCCRARPDDAELPTPHRPDTFSDIAQSSQSPVLDCDKVIGNETSDSAPIIDGLPDDIPADDDGVVFNTSDFEIVCAIKSDKELPNRLVDEFCEPVNCNDALHWDVGSLDLPHKEQMIREKFADSNAENLALHLVYTEENHRMSTESNTGVRFASECRETSRICDTVNHPIQLTQRPSTNIQTQVFSDISDDDDTGTADKELIPNRGADAEKNRLLLGRHKIPSAKPAVYSTTSDGLESILDTSNMATDRENQYGDIMDYDDSFEDVARQNTGEKLTLSAHQNNHKILVFHDTTCEKACHNSLFDKESPDCFLRHSNSVSNLPTSNCSAMHSLSEIPTGKAVETLKNTLNRRQIRRRRRNKLGNKTISDVVNMLRKISDSSESSGQQAELGTDAEMHQHMEKLIEEAILMTSCSELPEICEVEPDSPTDEAPPLLAITDLLNDGTDSTVLAQTEQRTTTASVGYDSDDTEVAMPVIEDMRSLPLVEDPAGNDARGNHEEENEVKATRKGRKTSKPTKRAVSTIGREVLELEKTRSLPVACDRCTFACGSEQALHQHIKVVHRMSARSTQQARYVCADCSATSDDRESFLDHLAHHPGQHVVLYYACSHCGTDAVNMETMEKHVSSSHNGSVLRFEVVRESVSYLDNLVNCPLCGAAFRWKKTIVDHFRNYHQLEQLAAYLEHEYREQPFPDKLVIHRNDVVGKAGISHTEAVNQRTVSNAASTVSRYRDLSNTPSSFNSSRSVVVHICSRCTFSIDDIDSYLEHYKGHFSTAGPTRAATTNITAKRPDQERTTDQNFAERPTGKIGGSYVCHLCPFKTPKRMFYFRHMAIHERNDGLTDGFRCGYCQFAHPRMACIKFHLGRYHGNRPTKVIRISGGVESTIFDDGQGDFDEDESACRSAVKPAIYTRNANQQVSGYNSLPDSSFPSTATVSKSALPVNQKPRSFASERLKRLNDFERRLPPSMVYEEPVKCPLCNFTNAVRINLIRHLRTHRSDDDEEEETINSDADNVSIGLSTVAESWQNVTTGTEEDTQASTEATAMNMHQTSIKSISMNPRMSQQLIENCLVNVIVFTICNSV